MSTNTNGVFDSEFLKQYYHLFTEMKTAYRKKPYFIEFYAAYYLKWAISKLRYGPISTSSNNTNYATQITRNVRKPIVSVEFHFVQYATKYHLLKFDFESKWGQMLTSARIEIA